jgi:mannonate dehydratase
MYIGEQFGDITDLSDRRLELAAQLGVEHVAIHATEAAANRHPALRLADEDGRWSESRIQKLRAYLASFGMTIDALHQELGSLHRDLLDDGDAARARRSLETVKYNLRTAAQAGIPCVKYNLQLVGIVRTGRRRGRGGATYAQFSVNGEGTDTLRRALRENTIFIDKDQADPADLQPIGAPRYWEAIDRYLSAVIPVADDNRIYLACHPPDPPLPKEGLLGIHHVLGSVDGMQKFIALAPSKWNVFNFCQGTVAEMCLDPATEVIDAIQKFGTQGRIYMVHFRNIKGGYLDFEEVYPDNGDVDMYKAMQTYAAVGFHGMLVPDHVPQSAADPEKERQFAFVLGYIRGLIQAVQAEEAAARSN